MKINCSRCVQTKKRSSTYSDSNDGFLQEIWQARPASSALLWLKVANKAFSQVWPTKVWRKNIDGYYCRLGLVFRVKKWRQNFIFRMACSSSYPSYELKHDSNNIICHFKRPIFATEWEVMPENWGPCRVGSRIGENRPNILKNVK